MALSLAFGRLSKFRSLSVHHLDDLAAHRFGVLKFDEHSENKTPPNHPHALLFPARNLNSQARLFMIDATIGYRPRRSEGTCGLVT
jgi:hypothetical protein